MRWCHCTRLVLEEAELRWNYSKYILFLSLIDEALIRLWGGESTYENDG